MKSGRKTLLIKSLFWAFIIGVAVFLWWQYIGFPTRILRDVDYSHYHLPSQRLDLYLPQGAIGPRPLIVFIHGGSWWSGDKADPPFLPLVRHGFAGASLNYRLSKDAKFPAQLDDCQQAIDWLKLHAKEYNIDSSKTSVWGISAGAHLAALLGLRSENRFTAICLCCPITDFTALGEQCRKKGLKNRLERPIANLLEASELERPDLYSKASPMTYVHASAPAFLVFHGKDDDLVPPEQSVEFQKRLSEKKVASRLVLLEGASHWFSTEDLNDQIESFFTRSSETGTKEP